MKPTAFLTGMAVAALAGFGVTTALGVGGDLGSSPGPKVRVTDPSVNAEKRSDGEVVRAGVETKSGQPPVVVPGAVGPVAVGMGVEEAVATRYVAYDDERSLDCGGEFLRWTKPYAETLDLYEADGRITTIGVWTSAVKTETGLGIGDTYAEIQAAYRNLELIESPYGQPGVVYEEDGAWLGFLFGEEEFDGLEPESVATFVEVTTGSAPSLARDGC